MTLTLTVGEISVVCFTLGMFVGLMFGGFIGSIIGEIMGKTDEKEMK